MGQQTVKLVVGNYNALLVIIQGHSPNPQGLFIKSTLDINN